MPTEQTTFTSHGESCAAWVTLPDRDGPHPAVVLVHGFGATHDMALPDYERRFAAAGLAVVSFDSDSHRARLRALTTLSPTPSSTTVRRATSSSTTHAVELSRRRRGAARS